MSGNSSKQRRPKPITEEEIRAVFERHGYQTTSEKKISIDVYDVLHPLLTISQWCQWWGQMLSVNGIAIGLKCDTDELPAVALHSASAGQKIVVAEVHSVNAVLNMLRSWVEGLGAYGQNTALRAERISDPDDVQISNEYLDSNARLILEIMALALPAPPMTGSPQAPKVE